MKKIIIVSLIVIVLILIILTIVKKRMLSRELKTSDKEAQLNVEKAYKDMQEAVIKNDYDANIAKLAINLYYCLYAPANLMVDSRTLILETISKLTDKQLTDLHLKYYLNYGTTVLTDLENEVMPFTDIDDNLILRLRTLKLM